MDGVKDLGGGLGDRGAELVGGSGGEGVGEGGDDVVGNLVGSVERWEQEGVWRGGVLDGC